MFLVADDIARKRGLAIDFLNADDQHLILCWLHCKLVRFSEKRIRYAVKLDKDWDTEDADSAMNALARLLTAPEQFDPLVRMLADEERFDPLALSKHSYSQASAYVILLHRFDWSLDSLAEHLRLTACTVRHKIAHSGVHMRMQPSLFDRINSIESSFAPTIARRFVRWTMPDSRQAQLWLLDVR